MCRQNGDALLLQSALELTDALAIESPAFLDIGGVGQRGDRCRLRERVDVERLSHAIQQVGDGGSITP